MPQYFTKDTDDSIRKFLEEEESSVKEVIFEKEIKPAFDKLIESLIFVYKFHTLDDVDTLRRDCLANLYEMLPKFDPNRGFKGFSYFNVVAKNWFIQKTKERSKQQRTRSDVFYDLDNYAAKYGRDFSIRPYEALVEEKEFWISFHKQMDKWGDRLSKKSEKQVLDAIVFLIKNTDHVPIYNKKAVYLYLRELTGLNTKQVVSSVKKIKGLYDEWKRSYLSGEEEENGEGDDRASP